MKERAVIGVVIAVAIMAVAGMLGFANDQECHEVTVDRYFWRVALEPSDNVEPPLTYEDDSIRARFTIPLYKRWIWKWRELNEEDCTSENKVHILNIEFRLHNKTDSEIKILWDESTMTFPKLGAERLVHGVTLGIEINKQQLPTVIPPHDEVVDMVFPRALVHAAEPPNLWAVKSGDQVRLRLKMLFDGEPEPRAYEFIFTIESENPPTTEEICPMSLKPSPEFRPLSFTVGMDLFVLSEGGIVFQGELLVSSRMSLMATLGYAEMRSVGWGFKEHDTFAIALLGMRYYWPWPRLGPLLTYGWTDIRAGLGTVYWDVTRTISVIGQPKTETGEYGFFDLRLQLGIRIEVSHCLLDLGGGLTFTTDPTTERLLLGSRTTLGWSF